MSVPLEIRKVHCPLGRKYEVARSAEPEPEPERPTRRRRPKARSVLNSGTQRKWIAGGVWEEYLSNRKGKGISVLVLG